MTFDTLRTWLSRNWPNVAIVVGTMLLTLGLSGYQGGVTRTGALARYSRGAQFVPTARIAMVGAALIVTGVLYRRAGS